MAQTVLTVSQVNAFLKSLIEGDGRLDHILVTGEISNFKLHERSGHLYFSLKDSRSVLKSVMFASSAGRLKFRPEDGMKVIVRGRVSVYEAGGSYQLYAEDMQPDGVGALAIAYEQLKNRLAAQGYFDPAFKKPIPKYPMRIGVITSPTGAAIQDILQITKRRWSAAEIILCPVLVQGDGAPPQLISAMRELNAKKACDVIIIGRGGGSIEDLWAFNDEGLARAIFESEIPVVSAVGHETDFTICDLVADLRAPTPSAAAEFCTPSAFDEKLRVRTLSEYFKANARETVEYQRQRLKALAKESVLGKPEEYIGELNRELKYATEALFDKMARRIESLKKDLSLSAGKLDALSPLKVLSRGYSVVFDGENRLVREADKLSVGDEISVKLQKGGITAEVTGRSN